MRRTEISRRFARRIGISELRRVLEFVVDEARQKNVVEIAIVLAQHASDEQATTIEQSLLEILQSSGAMRLDALAQSIACQLRTLHDAEVHVHLKTTFSVSRWTPVSGKSASDVYSLIGFAFAADSGVRRAIGVEVQVMTASARSQEMLRNHSVDQLIREGFSQNEVERILNAVPSAAQNQRGTSVILLGADGCFLDTLRIADLVEISESAASSETYSLLKRPDEFFVVRRAHLNPRSPNDVVCELIDAVLKLYADFPDDSAVSVKHVDMNSSLKHNSFAEACGLFGTFRGDADADRSVAEFDMRDWLIGASL